MRSLFSGIFKDLVAQSHQQLRARNVGRVMKSVADKPKAQQPIDHVEKSDGEEAELKIDQKTFMLQKEQEQQKLKDQYEQQFKKVEQQIEKAPVDQSRHNLLKETRERYNKSQQENKFKQKQNKFEDMSNVKYYNEQDLNKLIRKSINGENLFRLYNAHKFTYTTKNLVHTLTKYSKLVTENKNNKLAKYDRRVMTLLMSLQSNTNMLTIPEKSMVLWSMCKLNLQEEIVEKLIKEQIQSKQQLRFKDISILLWVMGKFSLKQTNQLNEICLEICLRLDDPQAKIFVGAEQQKEEQSKNKTEDEMEFDDLEELLELPESKENTIETQSLSMALWSLGKLSIYDEDLMKSALHIVTNNLDKFSPLMLTNILYSFSAIKFNDKEVFKGLCENLKKDKQKLKEENVLTLKTLLISLCKLKIDDKEFIMELAHMIIAKTNFKKYPMSPRFMSELLYSLSKQYIYDEKIYNKLAHNTINVVDKMNIQDCCESLYAFSKYLKQNKSLQAPIQSICTRISQLEGKINNRYKDIISNSIKIGNIKNKELTSIMKK